MMQNLRKYGLHIILKIGPNSRRKKSQQSVGNYVGNWQIRA